MQESARQATGAHGTAQLAPPTRMRRKPLPHLLVLPALVALMLFGGWAMAAPDAASAATPSISRLSQGAGPRLAKVTITGRYFGARRGTSYVRFGVKKCRSYLSWSATKIVCRVPAAAAADKVLVKVTVGSRTSRGKLFIVLVPPPPGVWSAAASDEGVSFGIMGDGTLWAWGTNTTGQLGLGDAIMRITPVRVGTATGWASIACGPQHTLAVKADGSLWAWGYSRYGRLGLGTTTNRSRPTRVGTANDWAAVACGDEFTVALKSDGSLWSWGHNSWGQLGQGDEGAGTDRLSPTRIGTDTDWTFVSCGGGFTLASKSDGSIWSWGENGYGQLGLGELAGTSRTSPTQVGTQTDWVVFSCGDGHVVARKVDGSLWTWGWDFTGQLGQGDAGSEYNRPMPTRVGLLSSWGVVSAGGFHTLAGMGDGSLWGWGDNGYGQLGFDHTINPATPTRVGADSHWAAVICGGYHTLALKSDGSLWSWGDNEYGELGLRDRGTRDFPSRVGGP